MYEQLAELPLPSAKVNVTVVSPTGNRLPGCGVTLCRMAVPDTSTAVAEGKSTAIGAIPTSTVLTMFAGQVTVGGVVSTAFQTEK